ncbi:hypothetical protein I4U23_005944 [Adineta vaga]|nr:hypothetical protein I4U23_005944 [Adineta vaga]
MMHYLSEIIRNPLLPIDSNFDRIDSQCFQINYKIHSGFTFDEEILIKKALIIIADRFCQEDIIENMYRICGTTGCLFAPSVWSCSKLANEKDYCGIHNLLRFQLMCLKVKGEKHQFPIIHLYPIYEKTDTQAEGILACISCISQGSTFSIKGTFNIKLNRYNLDAKNEQVGNSIYWAGVIVHEMLHNLGHKHRINDYSDHWQINVFEKCFLYNGKYSP